MLILVLRSPIAAASWLTTNGLRWPSMIEPENSGVNDSVSGTVYYVDRDASDDGDGSAIAPYRGFKQVLGYFSGGNFVRGVANADDMILAAGTFLQSEHIEGDDNHHTRIDIARTDQGADGVPLIIKAMPGRKLIFDGEYRTDSTDMIDVRASGDIVLQNIEVKRCYVRPIFFRGDPAPSSGCTMYNVWVHHTWAFNNGDTHIGGFAFSYRTGSIIQECILDHCLFHDNDKDNTLTPIAVHNNQAEIRYEANNASSIAPGSYITIRNCEIRDGARAIACKHANDLTLNMYNNHISDFVQVLYIRNDISNVYNNLIRNITNDSNAYNSAFYLEAESQKTNQQVNLYKNTFYNIDRLLGIGNYEDSQSLGSPNYLRNVLLRDNAVHAVNHTGLCIDVGDDDGYLGTGIAMPYSCIDSYNNVFFYANSANNFMHFDYKSPLDQNFADSMTSLGDSTSTFEDPDYTNAASLDFTPASGSPLINNASDGGNIGAF